VQSIQMETLRAGIDLLCVRWYFKRPLSYRNLKEMVTSLRWQTLLER